MRIAKVIRPLSCDVMQKSETISSDDLGLSNTVSMQKQESTRSEKTGLASQSLGEIEEVEETLEASEFNSKIYDLGNSMVDSRIDI